MGVADAGVGFDGGSRIGEEPKGAFPFPFPCSPRMTGEEVVVFPVRLELVGESEGGERGEGGQVGTTLLTREGFTRTIERAA